MIINTINSKKYVGVTTRKNGFNGRYSGAGKGIERVYGHMQRLIKDGQSYNKYLYRSINKYGFNNFKVNEIHDTAFSKDELLKKERYWIEEYKSYDVRFGYNHTNGGEGLDGCVRTFKTKLGMRLAKGESIQYRIDYWLDQRLEWDNPLAYIWDSKDGLNAYQKTVLAERIFGIPNKKCDICSTPLLKKEKMLLCNQCSKPEFLQEYKSFKNSDYNLEKR